MKHHTFFSSKHLLRLSVGLMMLPLFGASCFGTTKQAASPTGPDMGIWKTTDHGQTWVHKKAYVEGPKLTAEAADLGVQFMTIDPQDPQAVYLATDAKGLVYTYDGGDSWQRSTALEVSSITAAAVDPKNKCTVYAVSANKVYKTETCGRDWSVPHFDPRLDVSFTEITVDWFTPTILYAGMDNGNVIKSIDGGKSWEVIKSANAAVSSLIISPHDSRVIYAGTDGDGIWKSLDSGITWVQIRKQFGDIGNAKRVFEVVPHPADPQTLYVVHKDGIAVTHDQGETWEALKLITDVGETNITDLAIDPNNPNNLVYIGPTALAFSADAGATWESNRLPSTNKGSTVLIDPTDGNTVYIGIMPAKRRK